MVKNNSYSYHLVTKKFYRIYIVPNYRKKSRQITEKYDAKLPKIKIID